MTDEVARFKYQRMLAVLNAGEWFTSAEFFAAVPRDALRWPWQANAWINYLDRKKLIEVNRKTEPLRFRRIDDISSPPAGSA